ncbi:MAG: hypothetical protein K2N63_09065 [Lachnospiraceae bacterium]|nr:hypothetical protein [Lachnospiraceae bacterium]
MILWGGAALCKVLRAAFSRGDGFFIPAFSSDRIGLSQFKAADVMPAHFALLGTRIKTRGAGLYITKKYYY